MVTVIVDVAEAVQEVTVKTWRTGQFDPEAPMSGAASLALF
jgi:hypothetical protein